MKKRRTAQHKKLDDDRRLLGAWRKWHRERLEQALEGPHAVICIQVVEFLKTMTPASANALLALMRSQSWEDVDANTKFMLLHEINRAITALRERMGMPPIDDPLPGAPENAFQIIKAMFMSFPPHAGEHTEVNSVNRRSVK